jgi:alkanesulfonate monooxygenase SsuD/methylene tetrahydromethanopterin reductase-like flavin-dependent oxidoreductase (luciferase family)
MRTGVIILQDQRWVTAQQRWQRAEEYGFDHAWTYDHIGWRDLVDGPWFDGLMTLTAAATVTSRIRLGTMVASANFRHPVPFARELTALDDISDGRAVLGVGAGGFGYDATVLGQANLTLRERTDRFAEFLELLDLVLRRDRTTWQGRYYAAVDARRAPGCVQQPRLPFVVAANGPRAMRLATTFGQGWVTSGLGGDDRAQWWQRIASLASRFDETAARSDEAAERVDGVAAGAGMDRYLVLDATGHGPVTSAAEFVDEAGRAAELGFTDVLIHWPRPEGWYAGDEATLEAIADARRSS